MLAVTTRNVLRSPRLCAPMLLARREIAGQLACQPGLLRYSSGLCSATEFLTLTVWRDREAMQRFMQSGAHERHMWQFTRWTSSFWGMRWVPLTESVARPSSPLAAVGLLPREVPLAGPLGPRPEHVGVEPRASGVTCVTAIFNPRDVARRGLAHGLAGGRLRGRALGRAASAAGGPPSNA